MASFTPQTSFVLLLLLFATTFNRSLCSKNRAVRCNENDQRILFIFKQGVVDPSNLLSSWTTQEDCCSWVGVQCDKITGRVTELDLANLNGRLYGEINLSLLQLEFLNYLNLSRNLFEAVSIPPSQVSNFAIDKHSYDNQSLVAPSNQLANFSALHYLDLSKNYLRINDLHWLSRLSSLKYLDLSDNDIGNETKWLQYMAMLPSLSELRLSNCELRAITKFSKSAIDKHSYDNQSLVAPSNQLANFSTLHYLDLSQNYLRINDLHWLSRLSSLKYLDLSWNDIGNETKWLQYMAMLPSLSELHLSYCELNVITKFSKSAIDKHSYDNQSLAIPSNQLANFSALHYLDLSQNYLRINDLYWLSQLSSLKYLDLSGNDIGNETKWLQYMAMLPLLSELRLSDCSLRDSQSLNFVNFTSLVTLDLSGNDFNSELSNGFFNFTCDISNLELSGNNFYGQIPIALFRLRNLKSLYLRDNKLNGSIPSSLGNLSSLIHLVLSNNHLSGTLPKSLGQLHNLEGLYLNGNSLVGVLSEKNFANLSKLNSLSLGSNGFKFDFDPNWVPPFQLNHFDLRNASLGPNVPAWLYTQRSLEELDISSSGISTIDGDIFWSFVAGIDYVNLSYNLISGDLSNVTLNSTSIYLNHNNFTEGLPQISAHVNTLSATHNSFSRSVFPLLCHPKSSGENMLSYLDISYNHLIGTLPDCWANWKQLEFLNLGSNKLTGEIPPSMATLSKLLMLDLSNNNFFGKFSLDLSSWTRFEYLFLERNKFSGSSPNKMPKNLKVLKLRSNQFMGNIPPQIWNLSSLMILDLADNKLSGSMPRCTYNIMGSINELLDLEETINVSTKGNELKFKNIWWVRSIDLSTNNLSGEIPQELFRLILLWSLNLSRNHLTGKIPKEIGGMKNLESLDLSHNKLSGQIPYTISNLSFLDYLNLSYNSFSGQIPLGTQLQSFDSWSFVGNLELCGDPLPKKCKKQKEIDNSKLAGGNEDDNFLKSLYLGMGVGFAVGFWGVCGSLFLIRAWRHRFFRLFEHLKDRLYVAVALNLKSFR